MNLVRPIQVVLECSGAMVYNEASESYLRHQEVRSKGLLSDPEGELELY
jgi:hypothetical protein